MSEEMASHFSSTGWYDEKDLEDLIGAARPDLFLFASTAPETYSFTLTKAMRTACRSWRPRMARTRSGFGVSDPLAVRHRHRRRRLAQRICQYAARRVSVTGGRHVAG
jgi:hypothetical protein